MKKFNCVIVTTILAMIFVWTPVSAAEYSEHADVQVIDINHIEGVDGDLRVSKAMNPEETIRYFMKESGVSYNEAEKELFPDRNLLKVQDTKKGLLTSKKTRVLTVSLPVTPEYKPHLEFYCYTSEEGNYWGIKSIYSVQLVRGYKGTSKQFKGDIKVWLRSPYSIEYVVNGDFYKNGTTTVSGGVGINVGIDDVAQISCDTSSATTSNHYKYFYSHKTLKFQS